LVIPGLDPVDSGGTQNGTIQSRGLLAWLGLAYMAWAWLVFWPKAKPCTLLVASGLEMGEEFGQ